MRERYTRHPRPILWLVRGGEAMIGGAEPESRPRFAARVESFYLSKSPVSNEQYAAFDPRWEPAPASPGPRDAAIGLSWRQARAYCEWYAAISRKAIRLPFEVEWEYACRAGTVTPCFWGDRAEADPYVWDRSNCGERIGSFDALRPNPFGLLGMLGGVWEWTGSCFRSYPLQPDDAESGSATEARVLRGGSFREERGVLSASLRRGEPPDVAITDAGFRIARSFSEATGRSRR